MSKGPTISERIRAQRIRFGLTQEQFAARLGFTRSYISQLESEVKGKVAGPKFLKRLLECEHTSDTTLWPAESGAQEPVHYGSAAVRWIPLISWAQAGVATAFEEIPHDWQEKIPVTVSDKSAFAIQLRGDSMEPKYSDGDVVTVLPNSSPRNGDLVVANIKEEGFAFKILNLVGGDPNHLKLTSYNTVYSPLEYPRDRFHWIYPVHSVTKLIRR